MKKRAFILIALLFGLVGCSGSIGSINVDEAAKTSQKGGALSDFDLVSPTNNAIVESVDEFRWEECPNAEKYSLEICSDDRFINDVDTIDYYKKENIVGTSFKINSLFKYKERDYFWRVTAYNFKESKESKSVFSFFIKAPEVTDVSFDLGESDDWKLHELGSYADIAIDNSNFFGNQQKSLKISFETEDTKRGVEESDGWIIVTRQTQLSIYGTDSLYFNCFYSGNDSNIFIRLVDDDNEYWFCPIKLSLNSRQTVILRFDDFKQRTQDVPVSNEHFDYEKIKYFEVVFERTFGDGVFLISDVKAIKFANYANQFITKLDFTEYDETKYTYEAYEFETSFNGKYEMSMKYYGDNGSGKPKIDGYGFVKINVGRYLITGDSIKFSVKYSGAKFTNAILRIYEEDTDRWSYKIPFEYLSTEEFKTVIIPYEAFAKSQILGDGKRQLYYIINLQFGLEGEYGTGELTYKDFEVVNKADYITDNKKVVGSDGVVENFDTYNFGSELYFYWTASTNNKDEFMTLNSTAKVGGDANPYCGQFEYKSDMEPANYYVPVTITEEFTSLSIFLKDASMKSDNPSVAYIEDYRPDALVFIVLSNGKIFFYDIEKLDRSWNEYDIPLAQMRLYGEAKDKDPTYLPEDVKMKDITHVGVAFQYYYIGSNGKPIPVWSISNPVFVDNICFKHSTEFKKTSKEKVIKMVGDEALVDDFEDYTSNLDLSYFWCDGNNVAYLKKEVSDNVSSEGGNKSVALQYKTQSSSPSYYIAPAFDQDVKGRVLRISMVSDIPATVYVNLYHPSAQYRATIESINTEWTEYVIGLNNFYKVGTAENGLTMNDIISITKISIGIVYWHGDGYVLKNLYVDNLYFDKIHTSYNTMTRRVIDE